jgi:hypothetical protein
MNINLHCEIPGKESAVVMPKLGREHITALEKLYL